MAEDRSKWTVEQWAVYAKELEAKLPTPPVDAFRARKVYQIARIEGQIAEKQALIAQYKNEHTRTDEIVAAMAKPGTGGVRIEVPPTVLNTKGN